MHVFSRCPALSPLPRAVHLASALRAPARWSRLAACSNCGTARRAFVGQGGGGAASSEPGAPAHDQAASPADVLADFLAALSAQNERLAREWVREGQEERAEWVRETDWARWSKAQAEWAKERAERAREREAARAERAKEREEERAWWAKLEARVAEADVERAKEREEERARWAKVEARVAEDEAERAAIRPVVCNPAVLNAAAEVLQQLRQRTRTRQATPAIYQRLEHSTVPEEVALREHMLAAAQHGEGPVEAHVLLWELDQVMRMGSAQPQHVSLEQLDIMVADAARLIPYIDLSNPVLRRAALVLQDYKHEDRPLIARKLKEGAA